MNPFSGQTFNRLSLSSVRPSRIQHDNSVSGSTADDRQMEINYVNLKTLEENTKNLSKEMCRYGELVGKLLNNSLCREDPPLRSVAECYHSIVYQTRDHTENLKMIARRTVAEPCKKLNPEFSNIANTLKKRESAIKELN